MSFSEVLRVLRTDGLDVTITKLRWAIDSGKVDRPRMDGTHRYVFEADDVNGLRRYFEGRHGPKPCAAKVCV